MTPARHAQRGLALITAMLVVAIVATIASYLSLGQQVWLRQVQNLFDRSQADSMRHAALDWAAMLLAEEAKHPLTSKTDDWTEKWNDPAWLTVPIEGGVISAVVTDAQGMFNLNNLVQSNGSPSANDIAMFLRLLQELNLSPALADTLVDWIDTNQTRYSSNGAEDAEYLASTPPYHAANQPLTSLDELRLVRGFNTEIVNILKKSKTVTVLPTSGTQININTAPAEVLAAMCGLQKSQLQPIVDALRTKPMTDIVELNQRLQGQCNAQIPRDVKTSHFLIDLNITYGRWVRKTSALISRPTSGTPASVLWHHPQYPELPRDGEDTKTNS